MVNKIKINVIRACYSCAQQAIIHCRNHKSSKKINAYYWGLCNFFVANSHKFPLFHVNLLVVNGKTHVHYDKKEKVYITLLAGSCGLCSDFAG